MSSILIVEDDVQLRQSFDKLLQEEGYLVRTASSGEEGIEALKQFVPDLLIMDVRLPGMSGMEAFQAIRKIDSKLPVIIMTAFGTTDTAIEATKLGAFDYVLKPFDIPDILSLIEQAIEAGRFMRSRVEMDSVPDTAAPEAIIGRSPAMQEIYKAIGRVAPTDATVLIRGESGTGKELVARALYQHSLRADKPFTVINCVAIPETLLESELFGYEKGTFTGAVARRIGKIEQANGGTIFLDEIGDMPLSIQAKILRLLQEKNIERLGGREPIPVDVRILAATNRNLEAALSEGRFREDLYYRLKVVTIEIPPLRSRKGDTRLLCHYFLTRFATEMGMESPGITNEALSMVENHPWHGNVRELANTLQKALIFSRGYPIRPEDISQAVHNDAAKDVVANRNIEESIRQWVRGSIMAGGRNNLFSSLIDHFTELLITEALNLTHGNRTKAAKLLGISRPTLHAKMEKCNLTESSEQPQE
ncbi:MAG: sigma-54-dependent Fis family transcriptional regulator [Candidatus Abyssobacteria bacterium SURF_5]|uniref:DNA-binding transcriptional regulator NtrC n=1 Tax=Abyssobacteria bacterium (strain SURF_5) TaxID=2093360 RepID=A0A3A4NK16_ABYX5|nr:MAG: sigma-54-dependent Fis family transcriptional regulator [Candidatus Abyssubacteria bacterium SURF_5]